MACIVCFLWSLFIYYIHVYAVSNHGINSTLISKIVHINNILCKMVRIFEYYVNRFNSLGVNPCCWEGQEHSYVSHIKNIQYI